MALRRENEHTKGKRIAVVVQFVSGCLTKPSVFSLERCARHFHETAKRD